jgi:hypothetical protein
LANLLLSLFEESILIIWEEGFDLWYFSFLIWRFLIFLLDYIPTNFLFGVIPAGLGVFLSVDFENLLFKNECLTTLSEDSTFSKYRAKDDNYGYI